MKRITQFVLAAILGLTIGTVASNCAHTTPSQFKDIVVTCTVENSSNSQAANAVLGFLTGAIAGDYGACWSGLVTAGTWTIQEIACVVRKLATESAQRLNAGTASSTDRAQLDNANAWLKANNIRFR